MKKLLFLLLSAAVAVSASAGINLKDAKKGMEFKNPVTLKAEKMNRLEKKSMSFGQTHQMNLTQFNAPNRAATDLITEQPEGELKTYERTGYATYYSSQSVYADEQEGTVDIVYAADGSTVYIKDPICYLAPGTWVKGTINGNKLSIPLGQFITWNSTYNYGLILAWGSVSVDADNYITYVNDDTATEATFTIDGNTISLDNSSADVDNFAFTGFTAIWDDDLTWQGYIDALTVWSPEPIIYPNVENLAVAPAATTADVTWDDAACDTWYLRYRQYKPNANYFWDFETQDSWGAWSTLDGDEDGNDWFPATMASEGVCPSGVGCFASYSYISGTGGISPENYLISPNINLHGVLQFYAWGGNSYYYDEHLLVYVLTDDGAFDQIGEEIVTTATPTKYEFDLSAYEGKTGSVVICHTNCYDVLALLVDDVFVGDPNSTETEDPWTYVYDITATNYTIEGLTPETEYEVQVVGLTDDGHSYWSNSVIFKTLASAPDVYILGEANDKAWAANDGVLMTYDAENNVYTATVTFDGRGQSGENYFSFTTVLAENNDDGGWAYIAPFRFGAVSEGDFWYDDMYDGQPLNLTYENYQAYRIMGGEYKLTVSLENMTLVIENLNPAPEVKIGDVNRDGNVNISDVTALINHLLSGDLEESDNFSPLNANVNGDATVNISDVTSLINLLLKGNV
ncbi:MAG: choice-of-anchor J domain-containing protein [Muribaculaceae bacterium]|nr:choice-of-anchor J domain-containing protein [Muribaculaceae bacterium]